MIKNQENTEKKDVNEEISHKVLYSYDNLIGFDEN